MELILNNLLIIFVVILGFAALRFIVSIAFKLMFIVFIIALIYYIYNDGSIAIPILSYIKII